MRIGYVCIQCNQNIGVGKDDKYCPRCKAKIEIDIAHFISLKKEANKFYSDKFIKYNWLSMVALGFCIFLIYVLFGHISDFVLPLALLCGFSFQFIFMFKLAHQVENAMIDKFWEFFSNPRIRPYPPD